MNTNLNFTQTPLAKPTGCFPVRPGRMYTWITARGGFSAKVRDAMQTKARCMLPIVLSAVLSLFQTGCVSLPEGAGLIHYPAMLLGVGPYAWIRKPIEARVSHALNPNTPHSTLEDMGHDLELVNSILSRVRTYDADRDSDWQAAMRALKRMRFPREVYDQLHVEKNPNMRCVVACNYYSPPELLMALVNDEEKAVRINLACNPATPVAALERLFTDSDHEVASSVMNNYTWQCHIVGTPHPKYRNVVWAENGKVRPANGYRWVSNDPSGEQDFRVELMPNLIEKDGFIYPASGYCWVSDDPVGKGDFRVQHILGTPHHKYPNVVWAENNTIRPAPGYEWVSNDPSGKQDFRVQHIPGTPHDKYPNVVWAENNKVRPAEGYCWVSDDPSGNQDFRVRLKSAAEDSDLRYWRGWMTHQTIGGLRENQKFQNMLHKQAMDRAYSGIPSFRDRQPSVARQIGEQLRREVRRDLFSSGRKW